MDGPAQRGSRGRGRSPRHVTSTRLFAAANQARARSAAIDRVRTTRTTAPAATPGIPDETTQFVTRSTYRLLVSRGLTPDEAATLTAFMCGIPIDEVRWSIRQVNQLLFLRELARTGRFGPFDGGRPRPH